MDLWIVLYAIALLLAIELVYALFKLSWYAVKMRAFSSFLKKLGKREGIHIQKHRGFVGALLGEKGKIDYTVEANGKKYEIALITFPSTRGRWNFEKDGDGYFIECRQRHRWFYKRRIHNAAPEHALDYRNETRLSKKPLVLPEASDGCEQILLLYPWPHEVTHTDAAYTLISPGDKVAGRVLMDKEMLEKTLFPEEKE